MMRVCMCVFMYLCTYVRKKFTLEQATMAQRGLEV